MDMLPLVPSRIFIGFSLALGCRPVARTKSGEMASSSEPVSQHMKASTPSTLTIAVKHHPLRILLRVGSFGFFMFGLEAQTFCESALNCFVDGPWSGAFIPLPRSSY